MSRPSSAGREVCMRLHFARCRICAFGHPLSDTKYDARLIPPEAQQIYLLRATPASTPPVGLLRVFRHGGQPGGNDNPYEVHIVLDDGQNNRISRVPTVTQPKTTSPAQSTSCAT